MRQRANATGTEDAPPAPEIQGLEMKTAHKTIVANVAALTAFVIAFQLKSRSITAGLFGAICLVVIVLVNAVMLWLGPLIRERRGMPPAKPWTTSSFCIAIGYLLLILAGALWWMHLHPDGVLHH
jgi:hypothetical protein